jgi:hypothetical protein
MKGSFGGRVCQCGKPLHANPFAATWVSNWCEACRKRIKRHGDVRQTPVRKGEVRKIVVRLKGLVKRTRQQEQVEAVFREIGSRLLDVTTDDLTQPAADGTVKPWTNLWMTHAIDELQRVVGDIEAVQSGWLVAAMFVLQQEERPRRFASDDGFRFQLVRMWRSQTALACGSTYDAKRDRVISWHKDLPARVTRHLSEILVTAYGSVSGYMTTAVRKDRERQAVFRAKLDAAFRPLVTD